MLTTFPDVTKTCTALGENDYEYYEDAFEFSHNWELGVSLSLSASADFPLLPELSASFTQVLYEHAFTPTLGCLAFDSATKAGQLKPAESVTPQIDIVKLQATVERTGHLPDGVDPSLLENYADGPLPTSIKAAIDAAKKNVASPGAVGGRGIVSLLVAVAAAAIIL